jgi:hypothetical protein
MTKDETRSQEWIDHIEELVRRAESISDPAARAVTIELLRSVLDLHGAAIERILDIVFESGPAGESIIQHIANDELASSVLLLHDLHPDEVEIRVRRAVEKLQDMFSSLGAELSLISIEAATVRLRFESQRTWSGSPVKASIEKAIAQAAPEITNIEIEGLKEPVAPGFVPVSELLAGLSV